MNADVEALLKLQDDDLAIDALEDQIEILEPRLKELARAREAAMAALAKSREVVAAEERMHTMLRGRVEQHRDLRDRNTGQLDHVARPREAAAAMAQLEQAQKLIAEDEAELDRTNGRLRELRDDVASKEYALAEAEEAEQSARASVSEQRAELESRLAEARAERERSAAKVPPSMRGKYDRIRSRRRERAVYPLRGTSCDHCDTMVPTQRRNIMVAKGTVDVCEGCGVLLHAE